MRELILYVTHVLRYRLVTDKWWWKKIKIS